MDNNELIMLLGVGLMLVALAREVTSPNGARLVNALGFVAGLVALIVVAVR